MGAALAAFAAGPQTAAQDLPPGKVLIRRGPTPKSERQVEPQGPLLTLNLVILDAKGEPFPGLRDVDLDIRDDGKPMHAVFCRQLETAERQPEPLGPREYSNRPMGGNSQSTLVLLDLLNANLTERGSEWNDVVNALRKLESSERLFVYLLTKEGTLYPVRALPEAEQPSPPDGDAWVTQFQALLDDAMHAVNRLRPQEFEDMDARVQRTLSLLWDLSSDFASQPGRKCLVWISHGVPIAARGTNTQWHDYTALVERLGTDLARSGIAIYAVDQQTDRANPGLSSLDTLQQLAGLTGGQWFANGATEPAIRQAMSEGRAMYRIGYRPPLERWDNKFHRLRITAEGKGGIKLRVRSVVGYFGDKREADPWQRFALAAAGQADASEIGIRATSAPSEKVKGWIHLQVSVDAADLRLTESAPRGEAYTGQFLVAFGYYTTGWQTDLTEEIPIDLHLTAQEHDAILRDGVLLSFDRPVRAGASKIRIVVRDPQSGAVGSLTIPVSASPKQ
jgi:VWFA-related protein